MASFDLYHPINEKEDFSDADCLELEVFMESKKLYIRSKLNEIPVFEIEGDYTDPMISSIIESIHFGILSDKICELFEGCSSSTITPAVKCTIFDERNPQGNNSVVYLKKKPFKEDVLRSAISVASPCILITGSNSTKLCY
ncbi:hypothetical protein TVAG_483370 [Trichomonas vaginalis G3]|uniref:Uncharacterized protein n=1 Tax=Trichomonas vaginalis (strain ATCC PRA-98 / G3) TaxID=412133 RepID=A2ETA9_TRIV3|nr:hypothetical protein TVAGG3_0620330 [Trichomonas vaginalis G3]EAY04099.1 hypothetical protein TVAG_483370 [Trichomonas vaginalis G3]KAI5503849.1 hypothetical protein TVAGG3_0620330 [Trichomonas vaginalis G3]|eukprot:XP_001316322.1 hypothetical protein [Trichomonas vaginalis G3]